MSLTFGLTITVLAYTIGGRSGGHINGAVTLGLFAAKQIKAPNGSSESGIDRAEALFLRRLFVQPTPPLSCRSAFGRDDLERAPLDRAQHDRL